MNRKSRLRPCVVVVTQRRALCAVGRSGALRSHCCPMTVPWSTVTHAVLAGKNAVVLLTCFPVIGDRAVRWRFNPDSEMFRLFGHKFRGPTIWKGVFLVIPDIPASFFFRYSNRRASLNSEKRKKKEMYIRAPAPHLYVEHYPRICESGAVCFVSHCSACIWFVVGLMFIIIIIIIIIIINILKVAWIIKLLLGPLRCRSLAWFIGCCHVTACLLFMILMLSCCLPGAC